MAKQERDKQELLQKQERDKQEWEKREALMQQKMQAQEMQLKEMQAKADAEKERQTKEAASTRLQEDMVSEIIKETAYSVGQAAEAVVEAAREVQRALQEAELKRFFEAQKQELGDFMVTEMFQGVPGERKKMASGKIRRSGSCNHREDRKIAPRGEYRRTTQGRTARMP
jgi:hypothetical protein